MVEGVRVLRNGWEYADASWYSPPQPPYYPPPDNSFFAFFFYKYKRLFNTNTDARKRQILVFTATTTPLPATRLLFWIFFQVQKILQHKYRCKKKTNLGIHHHHFSTCHQETPIFLQIQKIHQHKYKGRRKKRHGYFTVRLTVRGEVSLLGPDREQM